MKKNRLLREIHSGPQDFLRHSAMCLWGRERVVVERSTAKKVSASILKKRTDCNRPRDETPSGRTTNMSQGGRGMQTGEDRLGALKHTFLQKISKRGVYTDAMKRTSNAQEVSRKNKLPSTKKHERLVERSLRASARHTPSGITKKGEEGSPVRKEG